MSGTKKLPESTNIRYDLSHRIQAQEAYRHHLDLVGRSGDTFTFSDVVDLALVLLIDMQGDVEASASLFRATAMEEIARSHVLLQAQLEAIHEVVLTLRNPPPNDEDERKKWAVKIISQIEVQVTAAVVRVPLLHKAILRNEKQVLDSTRKRREVMRAAVRNRS